MVLRHHFTRLEMLSFIHAVLWVLIIRPMLGPHRATDSGGLLVSSKCVSGIFDLLLYFQSTLRCETNAWYLCPRTNEYSSPLLFI